MNPSPPGSGADPVPYLDTEDWFIPAVFTDGRTGVPLDLTGSLLRVTFVSFLGVEVATASTEPDGDTGTITITDPPGGAVTISIPIALRNGWIAPPGNGLAFSRVPLRGHVLRRPGPADTDPRECVGIIDLIAERGSTAWPS